MTAKSKAIKLDTTTPKTDVPSKSEIEKAEKLARQVSPLLAELFNAKVKENA